MEALLTSSGQRQDGAVRTYVVESLAETDDQQKLFCSCLKNVLIAEFYLVDRGLRHRLPGFSSLNRRLSLRRVSAGSGTNGHTAVVALRGRTPGERGWFDRN